MSNNFQAVEMEPRSEMMMIGLGADPSIFLPDGSIIVIPIYVGDCEIPFDIWV